MGHQINHLGTYDLCGAETVAAKRCGGKRFAARWSQRIVLHPIIQYGTDVIQL